MRKIGHYLISGTIKLLSGTRIGGSDDVLQIGGTDLTCIKNPVTGAPYLPGSSLKGKMRSELERHHGKASGREGNRPCNCAQRDCPICRIFGPHAKTEHELGPTRIIVRDAYCLNEWTIEQKSSTAIDRSTGAALRGSLRTDERVAPGAEFSLEIGIQEFDVDSQFRYTDASGKPVSGRNALLAVVYHGIDFLEDSGIGAGVGKGYGNIEIRLDDDVRQLRRRRSPPQMPDQPAP